MRRYGSFTPARRAALKRASLISAAKRKAGPHKPKISSTTKRRLKYAAVGAGAIAGAGVVAYGGHRAVGGKLTVSRNHTPFPNESLKPVKLRMTKSSGQIIRTKHGKQTIASYATGIHGVKSKQTGNHPVKVTKYKPSRGDNALRKRVNRSRPGSEQYARDAMGVRHTNDHYANRKIEYGEAHRRTNAYVKRKESAGKKVSAAERYSTLQHFQNQPRYPGGTVKPLSRKTTRGRRNRQRRYYERKYNSIPLGPQVLGARRRPKKVG